MAATWEQYSIGAKISIAENAILRARLTPRYACPYDDTFT
jgi:hypothetical protein